jgi:formate transporter
MIDPPVNMDAYAPAEMATRVETVGVAKAHLDAATMFALAVLAGAFIALGANVATMLLTEHGLGYGVSRVAGGVVFSLGLMLVIVGGAELFTGNTLMVMAWASGKVSTGQVIRNWMIVYAGSRSNGTKHVKVRLPLPLPRHPCAPQAARSGLSPCRSAVLSMGK